MKTFKICFVALLFSMLRVVAGPPRFVNGDADNAGYIEVSAQGALCGSMEIKPKQSDVSVFVTRSIDLAAVHTKSHLQQEADSKYTVRDAEKNEYLDKDGNIKVISDIDVWKKNYMRENRWAYTDYKGGPNSYGDFLRRTRMDIKIIPLPNDGFRVKYDWTHGVENVHYRIYVLDSEGFPVSNPSEFVEIRSIKHNVPCIGILGPQEGYEPLMMNRG